MEQKPCLLTSTKITSASHGSFFPDFFYCFIKRKFWGSYFLAGFSKHNFYIQLTFEIHDFLEQSWFAVLLPHATNHEKVRKLFFDIDKNHRKQVLNWCSSLFVSLKCRSMGKDSRILHLLPQQSYCYLLLKKINCSFKITKHRDFCMTSDFNSSMLYISSLASIATAFKGNWIHSGLMTHWWIGKYPSLSLPLLDSLYFLMSDFHCKMNAECLLFVLTIHVH